MPPFDLERRRRRNRRLALLGVIAVFITGICVTVFMVRVSQRDQADRQRLVQSVVAYESADYGQVVELLEDTSTPTNTLRVMQGDADAMWRYVQARLETPMPNGEHVARMFPALRRVVSLDPGNREAGQMLLELLMAYSRNTEALDTASRLITAHPGDVELLRIRSAINVQVDNKEDALDDALAAAQLEPLDVRTQMEVATLMRELNRNADDFFERATALLAANPGDPRAEVILARANLLVGLAPQAEALLESASDREPPNDDFVQIMVKSLDLMQKYDDSYAYLQRVVGDRLDDSLEFELFLRDFESEQDRAVIERFASIDTDSAATNLVALTAISHGRLGQTDDAARLHRELTGRADDPLAQHWAHCLEAWWTSPLDASELVRVSDEACQANPNHAYLHYLLAEGYRAVGELEAAAAALRIAHTRRQPWAQPYNQYAEVMLELGRAEEAEEAAYSALRRRPVPAYAATYGVAMAAAANANDRLAVDRALTFIDEKVLAQFPDEPRTFAAAVELLARSGQRDAAVQRISSGLDREQPLPQATLMQLAETSRDHGLSMEQPIYTQARAVYGASPQMVLEQAYELSKRATIAEAVELLRSAMPSPPTLIWQVAEAQLLEILDDPGAPALWIKLADDFPGELQLQKLALAAVGVQQDRAFADRVIGRMRDLAGPDSVGWKVERARYLLGSLDPAASARQASELLEEVLATAPNRVEAYRLLAHCQQLRGDNIAAARSIEQAVNRSPDDMRIQFQLGQLLHNERQFIAARKPLLLVARNEQANPNLRLNALVMLSRQGEIDTLIPILEGMQRQYIAPDQQNILHVRLYMATGRARDADQICELMLQDPTPSAIAYAADYYWRTGRGEEAQRVVELVDQVEMPDDFRHTILGQHAARQGEFDLALNHLRAAALAAPAEANRWEYLVVRALVFGNPSEAIQDARTALSHLPDEPGMRAIADNAELLEQIAGDIRFRPIAATIAGDATYRTVGLRAMRLIVDASSEGRSTAAVALELADLADEYPQYLQLQNLSAAMLSDVARYGRASEIAERTMALFPSDVLSPRLAAVAFAEQGDWRRTIIASQNWFQRSPAQRPLAVVYLSAAQRNLGRTQDAEETLRPYVEQALTDPDRYRPLLGEYATVLVQLGRLEEGWAILSPNLDRDPVWRELAMELAGSVLPNRRSATQWLNTIEQSLPEDQMIEQLMLAQATFYAGDRLRDAALVGRARALVDRATQAGQAPAGAWMLRGQIAEGSGDLQIAEESYRQALAMQPNSTLAQNNLAMVLVQRGRDMDLALDLAQAAAGSDPKNPTYQDTLARVLSRAGQHDEALRVIELAIQRDRQNSDWIRTKAEILDAAGRNDEAQRLRQRNGLAE